MLSKVREGGEGDVNFSNLRIVPNDPPKGSFFILQNILA